MASTSSSTSNETTTMRVYIVRHGETQENRDGIIQGQADTQLNAMGIEQARLLGEALKDVKFDCAFSSDLRRAVDTAKAILKHHPEVELVQHRELRERAMGNLQGKTAEAGRTSKLVATADAALELSATFANRVTTWWNQKILHAQPGRTVLVATHGGVITSLVQQLLGSRKLTCGRGVVVRKCMNACVSIVDVGVNRGGVLVSYGDVGHLEGMVQVLESSADLVV